MSDDALPSGGEQQDNHTTTDKRSLYQRILIGAIGITSVSVAVLLLSGFIGAFSGNPGPVFIFFAETYNPPAPIYLSFITIIPMAIAAKCLKILYPDFYERLTTPNN